MKKIIIACFLFILTFTSITLAHKPYRPLARYKACLSNIRVIQGAVEMYNMDSPLMLKDLNENSIDLLLKGNYLKSEPSKPDYSCKYSSKGDLSEDGEVYCEYHGGLDRNKIRPSSIVEQEIEEYLEKERKKRIITNTFYGFLGLLFLFGIYRFFILICRPKEKRIIDKN